ncbi:MAG: DUF5668 domain-containing protein [Chloroflexota bacterium]|jgi:hypothetical protein
MNRSGVFWGAILILLGVLLLLNSLGILPVNVWAVFWPLALVIFGISLLVGAFAGRGQKTAENLALQLKGYEAAEVTISYGAGSLTMQGGAAPDELLNGRFNGGVAHQLGDKDEVALVELRSPSGNVWNWGSWHDRSWSIDLNNDLPIDLRLDTGASESYIDLSKTQTRSLRLKTGASSNVLILPAAAGETSVVIEGGAGSVEVRIPDGVAARIEGQAALGELKVDRKRFPRSGAANQSNDYDTAANKTTIRVRFGVGEVKIA